MAHIKFEILHRKGGWCVSCGDTLGPPYNRKAEAVRDVNFIAELLRKSGDQVAVSLEQFDGSFVTIPE